MPTPAPAVRWSTKLAVLLREDLQPWQELNVTAFLASGLAASDPHLVGEPYQDADGTRYLPMFGQPVLVLTGAADLLIRSRERAVERGLVVAVFTTELFTTGADTENRAAVRAVSGADLDLAGVAVHGPRNSVDKALKGARMHP